MHFYYTIEPMRILDHAYHRYSTSFTRVTGEEMIKSVGSSGHYSDRWIEQALQAYHNTPEDNYTSSRMLAACEKIRISRVEREFSPAQREILTVIQHLFGGAREQNLNYLGIRLACPEHGYLDCILYFEYGQGLLIDWDCQSGPECDGPLSYIEHPVLDAQWEYANRKGLK